MIMPYLNSQPRGVGGVPQPVKFEHSVLQNYRRLTYQHHIRLCSLHIASSQHRLFVRLLTQSSLRSHLETSALQTKCHQTMHLETPLEEFWLRSQSWCLGNLGKMLGVEFLFFRELRGQEPCRRDAPVFLSLQM